MARLVRDYVTERAAAGELAPVTAASVRRSLLGFAEFVGDEPLRSDHVERWLGRPVARSTARQRFSHIRLFCRWAVRNGFLPSDPTVDLRAPRQPRAVPRGYKVDVVRRLLAVCPDSRARLIVLLEVQEGLRAVEVARLELGDVDFVERLILVRGKGGRQRLLPLSSETWAALEEYLTVWPAKAGPLIRSYNQPTAGLSPAYLAIIVGQWLRAAGAAGGGHGLRHTMATSLLRDQGADIRDVQIALGHSNLASTSVYLPFSDVNRLRTVMGGRWYGSNSQSTQRSA